MKLFAVSHLFVCLLMAALPSHPPIVEVTRPTPFSNPTDFVMSIFLKRQICLCEHHGIYFGHRKPISHFFKKSVSRSNILVRISHILHCSVHTHIWQISCLHYSPSSTTHLQQFPLLPPQQLCLLNIMAKPNTWGHSTSRKPGFPPTSSTAESYAYISPTPPILSLIGF